MTKRKMSYNKNMRRLFLILVLIVPSLAFAQPAIKFEAESHDFGGVREGTRLEHVFEFTNEGTEDLLVDRLVPS